MWKLEMWAENLCFSCDADGVVVAELSLFLLLIIYSLNVSIFFSYTKTNDLFWFMALP